jgi:Holliday junction resolvase-like predicted endonuclease
MDLDLTFWRGADAETAAAEVLAEMGGSLIENQFFTALFVPEIDLTNPQSEE